MKHGNENSPRSLQTFTPGQWQRCQASLWGEAARISADSLAVQKRIDELYAQIQSVSFDSLNLHERDIRVRQEDQYWDLQARKEQLCRDENEILSALEAIETSNARVEEVLSLLPQQDCNNPGSRGLSKRRLAIKREQMKLGETSTLIGDELGIAGSGLIIGATDPRRISSGNNRRRLVSGAGVPMDEAEGMFYDVTADTHGGKTRASGKTGGSYVGKSGRRIRKR